MRSRKKKRTRVASQSNFISEDNNVIEKSGTEEVTLKAGDTHEALEKVPES
jgi:hypothetical protein